MIIRPLSTSIATLLFAPDTEGAPAGGAAPAISAADSPTGEKLKHKQGEIAGLKNALAILIKTET